MLSFPQTPSAPAQDVSLIIDTNLYFPNLRVYRRMCAADEEDTECKDQLLSPDFQQYFLNVYLVSNISLSQEQLLIYFKPNHCQDHAAIEQQNTNSLLYNFTLQNQYLRVKRSQFQEFFLFNDLSIKCNPPVRRRCNYPQTVPLAQPALALAAWARSASATSLVWVTILAPGSTRPHFFPI